MRGSQGNVVCGTQSINTFLQDAGSFMRMRLSLELGASLQYYGIVESLGHLCPFFMIHLVTRAQVSVTGPCCAVLCDSV